jgi:hypothetical protein
MLQSVSGLVVTSDTKAASAVDHVQLSVLVSIFKAYCFRLPTDHSSTVPPDAQNLHPAPSRYNESQLYGPLEPKDNEWVCASGFVTETHIWYTICDDGTSLMCQVIHSSVGYVKNTPLP